MLRVAPKRKHTATSTHDDQVIEALKSSLIKLISCKWLRAQGKGFILPRCQELPDDAALSPEEAVEMFASNNRRVATLSYGWLTPQHPDPFGTRIAILIAFLNSEEGRNYDGLFLDFCSMPQKPRTEDEEDRMRKGLKLMANLYASALGSSVIRLSLIPPRPDAHDEQQHGEYNETAYSSRGWCVFETHCAMIVVGLEPSASDANKKATSLPPKLLELESGSSWGINLDKPPEPENFRRVLKLAKFTGKGDRDVVQGMYVRYYLSVGVASRLSEAQMQASRLRARSRHVTLAVAVPVLLISLPLNVLTFLAQSGHVDLGHMSQMHAAVLTAFSVYLFLSVVSPNDVCLIRFITWLLLLVIFALLLISLLFGGVFTLGVLVDMLDRNQMGANPHERWHVEALGWAAAFGGWAVCSYVCFRLLLPVVRGGRHGDWHMEFLRKLICKRKPTKDGDFSSPRLRLLRCWATLRIGSASFALVFLGRCAWMALTPHAPPQIRAALPIDIFVGVCLFTLGVALNAQNRGYIGDWLEKKFVGEDEKHAAIINALVGGTTDVHVAAITRDFKLLRLDAEALDLLKKLPEEKDKSHDSNPRHSRVGSSAVGSEDTEAGLAADRRWAFRRFMKQRAARGGATRSSHVDNEHRSPREMAPSTFIEQSPTVCEVREQLRARTEPGAFGEGNLYVSHSSLDNKALKWQALDDYAAQFEAEHGERPRVWLDVACAAPNHSDDDYRFACSALPIRVRTPQL